MGYYVGRAYLAAEYEDVVAGSKDKVVAEDTGEPYRSSEQPA